MESKRKATILVVDDDELVLDALREQLTWDDYDVVTSPSANEALEQLAARPFDVIISDQRMPGMLGTELLAEATRIQPSASRILITGVLSIDTVIEAINRGEIFRFLAKPWLRAELLATVSNAVHRHDLIVSNNALQARTAQLNDELEKTNATLRTKLEELTGQKRELDEAHEAMQANFDHSLELCYRIINTFHPVLGQHTKSVVEICRRMTEVHPFTDEEKRVLVASAWLHDIGLIGFDRTLLRKLLSTHAHLSNEEKSLLQHHPIYGQTLAAFVEKLTGVGETIRAHHERLDGKGYPDGLAGQMIPWTARCLAVAVHFVECGLPKQPAMESLLQHSGTAFDPEAVRLLLKVVQTAELPRKMREIMVDELAPGMKLAKGIYSPSGLLLVGEGQELNLLTIKKIKNHNLSTSVTQRLLVYS